MVRVFSVISQSLKLEKHAIPFGGRPVNPSRDRPENPNSIPILRAWSTWPPRIKENYYFLKK